MIFGLVAGIALMAAQSATPAAPPAAAKPAETKVAAPAGLRPGAVAQIVDASGKSIGGAYFHEGPSGVLIRVEVSGLTPGWHGIHLHEKGVCTGPGFQSAGGHINPGKKPHGLLHPQGPDNGDLPSIFVEQNGIARASPFTTLVSLKGAAGRAAILDADGSAIVIHAAVDNQSTQPIGGSGDRIACGVVKAAPAAK